MIEILGHIHCAYVYHGARNNLLSPSLKWTGSMLNKQQLAADQRISQKREDVRVDMLV